MLAPLALLVPLAPAPPAPPLPPAPPAPLQEIRLLEDHVPLFPDDQRSVAALAGDVDGDGAPDLVLVGEAFDPQDPQRLFLGRGDGTFEEVDLDDDGNPRSAALVDLAGDGHLDLVVGTASGARVWSGDGAGGFTLVPDALPGCCVVEAVATADVDGDGDLDVLLGVQQTTIGSAGQNRLYRGDGAGAFVDDTAASLPDEDTRTDAAVLADLDGDGDPDVVLGNGVGFSLHQDLVLENVGGGVYPASVPTPVIDNTRDLAVGDVDGDGDLDVLGAAAVRSFLLVNDGSGGFTDGAASLPDVPFGRSCALVDLDGDADLDAVLGTEVGVAPSVLRNDGGVFVDATTGALLEDAHGSRDVAAADLDADGDVDLVLANYGRQSQVYLNDGSAAFGVAPPSLPPDTLYTRGLAVGDVDGDGDLDALAANLNFLNPFAAPPVLYVGDGRGGYVVDEAFLPGVERDFYDAVLGDVDGDGDLDAYLVAGEDSVFGGEETTGVLARNAGGGAFVDATTSTPGEPGDGRAAGLADADADGDLDLLIGVNDATDRYWRNDGTGTFTDEPAGSYPSTVAPNTGIVWSDLDLDGVLEVVLAYDDFGAIRVYENDGAGTLSVDVGAVVGGLTNDVQGIDVGDASGDGAPDVVAARRDAIELLLVNDGSGTLSVTTPFGDVRAVDAALGDLDLDGDADLVLATLDGHVVLAQEAGAWTSVEGALAGYASPGVRVALLDADRDGDLDALFGNGTAANRLLRNRARHLAWETLPAVGKPLRLEVSGAASAPFLLGVALALAELPLPPFGVLGIDPGSLVVLAVGGLGADGSAEVAVPVPASPALVGTTGHLQALVGLALTNVETATLGAF